MIKLGKALKADVLAASAAADISEEEDDHEEFYEDAYEDAEGMNKSRVPVYHNVFLLHWVVLLILLYLRVSITHHLYYVKIFHSIFAILPCPPVS